MKNTHSRTAAVLLLAVAVVAGTAWAWVDYHDRIGVATSGTCKFDPAAAPEASQPDPVVVFIGDSYTAGTGAEDSGGFVAILAKREGWNARNLGVGGTGYVTIEDQDADNALAACGREYCENYPEVIQAAAELDPDVVVVSGGRNNFGTPLGDMRAAVDSFFSTLRKELPRATILATSPLGDDDPAPPFLRDLGGLVKASVEDVGGQYLNLGQPLQGRPQLLSSDGVHPNDAGHLAIAKSIEDALPPDRG